MPSPREAFAQWLRHGHGPVAKRVRRAGGTALGTYAAYLGYGLFHPGMRHPYRGPEAARPLHGDELVPEPGSSKTFAIDIGAPPEEVWALLVQMGYGRAGFYSWYPLDNGGVDSADAVIERLQGLEVGDEILDGPAPEGHGLWRVLVLEEPHALVLFSRREITTGREIEAGEPAAGPVIECTWAFVVESVGAGSRLLVRVRAGFVGEPKGLAFALARRVFDVGDTVMEWTMLDGIKARAERGSRMPPMSLRTREAELDDLTLH